MKTIFIFSLIFVCVVTSCVSGEPNANNVSTEENCRTFSDVFGKEAFTQILRDNLSIVNSKCDSLNIYYKPLSPEEDEEFFSEFNTHIDYLSKLFSDSSYFSENYEKHDLGEANICTYSGGMCNYYTQFIYMSKSRDVVYVRLFHENLVERYELLIKRNDRGGYDLLIIG